MFARRKKNSLIRAKSCFDGVELSTSREVTICLPERISRSPFMKVELLV
jgi:hypothetical protein